MESAQMTAPRAALAGDTGLHMALGAAADRRSIYSDCQREADNFKWIESEKAGHDLGEWAIKDWVRCHWWDYLRARWLEHLQGNCFWVELDRGDFGLLQRAFTDHRELLDQVVTLLIDGLENLGVIAWAKRSGVPPGPVIDILEMLDINSRRLVHQFDCVS